MNKDLQIPKLKKISKDLESLKKIEIKLRMNKNKSALQLI